MNTDELEQILQRGEGQFVEFKENFDTNLSKEFVAFANVVNNPGSLVPSFPMKEFGRLSWPRNRVLADLLSKTYFMERVGTGIKRMRNLCKESGDTIEIKPLSTHFFVEMESPKEGLRYDGVKVGVNVGVNVGVKLSESQKKLLELILEDKNITREELAQRIGISLSGIEKNITKLKGKGLLTRIGSDKAGYWKVENWLKDEKKDGEKYGVKYGVNDGVKLSETQKKIIQLISEDGNITRERLSEKVGISLSAIEKNIAKLRKKGLLIRIGSDKNGYWKVENWPKDEKKTV